MKHSRISHHVVLALTFALFAHANKYGRIKDTEAPASSVLRSDVNKLDDNDDDKGTEADATMFGALDVDEDGSLSMKEYSAFLVGIPKEAYARAKDETELAFFTLDEDGNHKLSRTEMAKEPIVLSTMEDMEHQIDYVTRTSLVDEAKFGFLDLDKDGSLSMQEYLGGLESDPIKEDEEHVFRTLDEDKNGRLIPDEMAKELPVMSAQLGGARSIAAQHEFVARMIDADKDGLLSLTEIFSAVLGANPSADEQDIYLLFHILDVDIDAKLSRAEMARANLVMEAIEYARESKEPQKEIRKEAQKESNQNQTAVATMLSYSFSVHSDVTADDDDDDDDNDDDDDDDDDVKDTKKHAGTEKAGTEKHAGTEGTKGDDWVGLRIAALQNMKAGTEKAQREMKGTEKHVGTEKAGTEKHAGTEGTKGDDWVGLRIAALQNMKEGTEEAQKEMKAMEKLAGTEKAGTEKHARTEGTKGDDWIGLRIAALQNMKEGTEKAQREMKDTEKHAGTEKAGTEKHAGTEGTKGDDWIGLRIASLFARSQAVKQA